MQSKFIPAKRLISCVPRDCGQFVVEAAKRAGARGGTKAYGRGNGMENYCSEVCPSDELSVDIIYIIMTDLVEEIIQAVVTDSLLNPDKISGFALVVDVPGMFVRSHDKTSEPAPTSGARSTRMESGNTLITTIITHGQADEVMAVARAAGAKGGTILNARGTGTEDDVEFFGISLAPEKEMLLIVADNNHVNEIIQAICNLPIFSEPGGGIVYTTNVEQFIVLGSS